MRKKIKFNLSHRNFPDLSGIPKKRDNKKFRFRLRRDQIGTKFRCDPAKGGPKGDSARAKRVPIWKSLKFDKQGLIPAIIQDYKTGQVLMLGFMNKESLRRTLKLGKTCFWSRSRKEYWIKGKTSGHYQLIKSIAYDCDMDALLIKVRQVGVACHTGNRSCFYRRFV